MSKEKLIALMKKGGYADLKRFLQCCGFVFCEECGKIVLHTGYKVDGRSFCNEHVPFSGDEYFRRTKEPGFMFYTEGTDGEYELAKQFNEALEEVNHV